MPAPYTTNAGALLKNEQVRTIRSECRGERQASESRACRSTVTVLSDKSIAQY
jgi:hypothetical protein